MFEKSVLFSYKLTRLTPSISANLLLDEYTTLILLEKLPVPPPPGGSCNIVTI